MLWELESPLRLILLHSIIYRIDTVCEIFSRETLAITFNTMEVGNKLDQLSTYITVRKNEYQLFF